MYRKIRIGGGILGKEVRYERHEIGNDYRGTFDGIESRGTPYHCRDLEYIRGRNTKRNGRTDTVKPALKIHGDVPPVSVAEEYTAD